MDFNDWMENVVRAFEAGGVVVLAVGSLWAIAGAFPLLIKGDLLRSYSRARRMIGHSILLGLEILIIADIVKTVTIEATLESAAGLALIVLVRTFLSFSLQIEMDGIVPWQRWRLKASDEP